ncbi:hypothetical protein SCALM49S_06509 [Streptomyces californicus]
MTTPTSDAPAIWKALTDRSAAGERVTTAAGIDRVWLDGVRRASLDKSVAQIGAPAAWKAGFTGKGVKIAVLDTGTDTTHPDLKGQVIAEKNFSAAKDTKDRVGHGTHVASIAAGTGAKSGGKFKGVAPDAKLLAGKVLDDDGYGDDSGILAGMEWAVAQGADIVNLSLGGPDTPEVDPLEAAVDKLSAEKGVLFAIAAGNEGDSARAPSARPAARTPRSPWARSTTRTCWPTSPARGPRIGDGAGQARRHRPRRGHHGRHPVQVQRDRARRSARSPPATRRSRGRRWPPRTSRARRRCSSSSTPTGSTPS